MNTFGQEHTILDLKLAEHQVAHIELPQSDEDVRFSASALRLRLLWPCVLWVCVAFGCLVALVSAYWKGTPEQITVKLSDRIFEVLPFVGALIVLVTAVFIKRGELLKAFAQKFLLSKSLEASRPVFEEVGQNKLKAKNETSNSKLVSYLAAGSFQGMRPLRYEKQVARNRFILLVTIFFLALLGIMLVLLKNH